MKDLIFFHLKKIEINSFKFSIIGSIQRATMSTINNDLYVQISKCFLMLYTNEDQESQLKDKSVKETFTILEKIIITSKIISIWYNQVSDLSIKSFICSNIQAWIGILTRNSQQYVRTLSLLRTLKYERQLKIDSLVWNQDNDIRTIKTKCRNSYQLFQEIKNYTTDSECFSNQGKILIDKIISFLVSILKNKRTPESAYYLAMIFVHHKSQAYDWIILKYLEISVSLDSPEGCFQLANHYFRGSIVQSSYFEAFRLYQKSGELGFQEGFYNAGVMLEEGLGTEVNIELSKKLFFKSITSKYSFGVNKLKELWGRFPDTFAMYITASKKGIDEFTDYLSTMYYYGIFVQEDREQSRELWIKGYQENSNLNFLKKLEKSFEDYPEDLELYETNSEQGDHEYSWRLGVFFKKGICGFKQNNAMAHKFWYRGSCSNHFKCQISLKGDLKNNQIDTARLSLEKSQLTEIKSEKEPSKQINMIMTFLNSSFDYLNENLNLMIESSSKLSQEYITIRLFKLILSTQEITEKILLNWYSQYHNRDFINLAHYYWRYLLRVKIETPESKLKNLLNIISIQQSSLRHTYLTTDPDFEDLNKKCKPIIESLKREILALKTQDYQYGLMSNTKIKELIDNLVKEERKTGCEIYSFYLGIYLSQLTSNNFRYLSLSFFYLFKSSTFDYTESKFNLGIICCHSELLEPNYELSRELLIRALKEGQKNACFPLGFLYYNQPNSTNNDTAYQYWFRGALYKNINCVYILRMLSDSLNLSKFKEMVQNGNFKLCYEIGIMLKYGISTPKNESEALSHWFLGLEKGISSCIEPIKIYFQENITRLKWYKKVSKSGNDIYLKRWKLIQDYKIHHI